MLYRRTCQRLSLKRLGCPAHEKKRIEYKLQYPRVCSDFEKDSKILCSSDGIRFLPFFDKSFSPLSPALSLWVAPFFSRDSYTIQVWYILDIVSPCSNGSLSLWQQRASGGCLFYSTANPPSPISLEHNKLSGGIEPDRRGATDGVYSIADQ